MNFGLQLPSGTKLTTYEEMEPPRDVVSVPTKNGIGDFAEQRDFDTRIASTAPF